MRDVIELGYLIDRLKLVRVEDEENYNDAQQDRMKRLMYKGLDHLLTPRQRECFQKYYGEEKNIEQIALILSLNKSTVSRHLKAARKNLKKLSDIV